MKVNKKILSVTLAVLCLLSCCSFSVYAADDTLTVSNFNSLMGRETQRDDGGTYINYYTFSEGTATVSGVLMHYWHADDPNFYASGSTKVLTTFTLTDVQPNHNYDLNFKTSISYSGSYEIIVIVAGTTVFQKSFNDYKVQSIKCNFDMPSNVVSGQTTVKIEYRVASQYAYGSAGQNVRYYISEYIDFVDRTDNPTWLQKILNRFTALGDTIGGFFSSLGDRIGGFFDTVNTKINNFKDNVGSWFSDLKETIKQKFVDLGNDIGEFFEKLKNYLLYFQHPVTTNSDGVLIGSDGKPVYTNPFESALQKVEDTVYDWLGKISNFLDSMEQSRVDVSGYLENGSALVNGVLKASPALAVCITFAVGFFVIRKVVGR